MTNVIIIEDRVFRQQNLLGDKTSDLKNYSFLKNISGGEDFTNLKNQIMEKRYSVFDEFSTILLHRSAFDADIRNEIMEYLKNSPKRLVLFSGGISGSQITKLNTADLMLMNVSDFYSEKLFLFLNDNAQNLLLLAFGDKWQTSILIDAIEKLTIYEKTYSKDTPFSIIESDLEFPPLITDKYFSEIEPNARINKSQITTFLENMNADLKEQL